MVLTGISALVAALAGVRITLEDFRERAVRLVWFILLALGGIAFTLSLGGGELYSYWLVNMALLIAIAGTVWLYARLRGYAQVMDAAIGWGDFAALAAFAFWFDTPGFFLFYTTGTVIALGWHLFNQGKTIPLAGILAVWGLVFIPLWQIIMDGGLLN